MEIERVEINIRAPQLPPKKNERITKLPYSMEMSQATDPRMKYLACGVISSLPNSVIRLHLVQHIEE